MFTLKSIVLTLIISLTHGSFLICGRSTARQETVKVAEQLFGRAVRDHPYLFEINDEYALTVDLNKSGGVKKVEVLPKYFFQGLMPDWREPDHVVGLSNNEYVNLLSKVGQLKPVGSVISEGKVGVVTNSKLWLLDEYENAFVQRRVNRTVQDTSSNPETMHSFSIYYIRNIEGLVDTKQTIDEFGIGQRFKVRIDGCSYLTSKLEFAKAKKGERVAIYAAGPLDATDCSTRE